MNVARDQKLSSKSESDCLHCGTPFKVGDQLDDFCCSGCEYVYRLIRNEDLDRYYELRDNVGQPVSSRVFSTRDFSWLKECFEAVETSSAREKELELSLQGISCVGCVWLIDKLFSEYEGGKQCLIDVQHGTMTLVWAARAFDLLGFVRKLRQFGYEVGPMVSKPPSETKSIVWRLALCGAFALNSMLFTFPQYLGMSADFVFARQFSWLSAFFATTSILFGGGYFFSKAYQAIKRGVVHMDMPISIGLAAAYLVSWYGFHVGDETLQYFDFVSTFVFLMLAGRWVHVYAIERNRGRLADVEVKPSSLVRLNQNGKTETIDIASLKEGDLYTIGVGEWAPVESDLKSESAVLGMDWINGESESNVHVEGSIVPSGAVNHGSKGLLLAAREVWSDSLLYRLLGSKGRDLESDAVTQRWIARYLFSVIVISVLGAGYWALVGGVHDSLRVLISALVVSCPCSLGIALPLVDELSNSMLKLKGVFLNTNTIWNRLRKVKQVVFDKTGTLTSSSLEWVNSKDVESLSIEERNALCELVSMSGHPVASSIRESLLAKGLYRREGDWSLEEEVGFGVIAKAGSDVWRLGQSGWAANEEGACTVLSKNGWKVLSLQFSDNPWPDAAAEIEAIEKMGLDVQILSGDTQEKVDKASEYLGLEKSRALGSLLPQEKESWLYDNEGKSSLMVGDGVNDSLAFDVALVAGTPAVEKTVLASKSDFYYLGMGIRGVRHLLKVARNRRQAIMYLLSFALTYNVIILGAAVCNLITPVLAAVFMPLSSIVSLGIAWISVKNDENQ
ncbi:heavy metal translocating P-type ATPase metal-binding domain-containing protein [Puniceicoccaceae bacterium K14]|nr:heavy metal translocating P-type ATPase metal-binding domain-containing protein [Puniceicoccaceae bacterium K14]